MARLCGHLRNAAAFGVLLTLLAPATRAGSIEIILTVSGIGSPITMASGSAFDTSGPPFTNPDVITINTQLLNSILSADGSSLRFSSLGATSNNPGAANAVITQTGTATTTGGAVSFSTLALQTGYTSPAAILGSMQSTASNTYTNTTAGDSQTFQSWYDPTNAGVKTTPSPLLTFTSTGPTGQSNSASAPLTPLTPFVVPFALLNQTTVTLAASAAGPTDQYTGSTIVSAVPEPTSLALLGIGMTGFLALRRLFKRTSAA